MRSADDLSHYHTRTDEGYRQGWLVMSKGIDERLLVSNCADKNVVSKKVIMMKVAMKYGLPTWHTARKDGSSHS